MKYTAWLIVLSAGFVAAQDGGAGAAAIAQLGFPQCTVKCVMEANNKSGCGPNDVKCQCTTGGQAFTAAMKECQCPVEDKTKAREVGANICTQNGFGPKNGGGGGGANASGTGPKAANPSTAPAKAATSSSGQNAPNHIAGSMVGLVGAAALLAF